MPQIKVHERVLAHLSRGLYRSPASALRELVSNAWDANATAVRINTGYPKFFQLSVEDNGEGFTREEFETLMEGGIGNSIKRTDGSTLKYGRPIIGRLGIGMLGIAQVCGAFSVLSSTKSGEGFKAKIRLYDLIKERLDKKETDLIHDVDADSKIKEVDIGEYEFEKFEPKLRRPGTLIFADDLHPIFVQAFQDSLTFEKFKRPQFDWEENIKIASSVHSLQELGDYWRLIWELTACCPVPYVSTAALPDGLARKEQKILESFNFEIFVDGIKLFKPVRLKGNPGGYTTRPIEPQHRAIYGRNLRFHGYILVQEGVQLRPDELRGILIRIKHVAVGFYDPSLLDYRFNEGPRTRWITGEIFVDEGLENALNIDRDSFNRFHPEFKTIQQYIHKILREEVFPKTYKKIEERTEERVKQRKKVRQSHFKSVLSSFVGAPVEIRRAKDGGTEASVRTTQRQVQVTLPSDESIKTKRGHRDLAAAILAIFEISAKERDLASTRQAFTKLLLGLLSKW